MAVTGLMLLTEASVGAPTLNSSDGSLNALINWACTTQGNWTREFHNAGTNESVFRANTCTY